MATLTADDISAGDYAHLVRNAASPPPSVIGQDESTHFQASSDGRSIRIAWGDTVQISSSVERPGDDTKSPPLIHMSLAETLAENGQLESTS